MNEIAIIMAAGKGERLRPLTLDKPKPVIPVNGKPMIETVIEALQNRGVGRIIIVTGYLGEKMDYLPDKYKGLLLRKNTEYETKNNISSLFAAIDDLGTENAFICEADLYIPNRNLLDRRLKQSCYFGKYKKGVSDDWVFEQKGDRIISIKKGGSDLYNMTGISFFLKEDAEILAQAIREAYSHSGHESLFWDEVVDASLDRINMRVEPVDQDEIIEIDTVEELYELQKRLLETKNS